MGSTNKSLLFFTNYALINFFFLSALSALDFVPKLAPKKKESMIRDINALMAESKPTLQRLSQDEPIFPGMCNIFIF